MEKVCRTRFLGFMKVQERGFGLNLKQAVRDWNLAVWGFKQYLWTVMVNWRRRRRRLEIKERERERRKESRWFRLQ